MNIVSDIPNWFVSILFCWTVINGELSTHRKRKGFVVLYRWDPIFDPCHWPICSAHTEEREEVMAALRQLFTRSSLLSAMLFKAAEITPTGQLWWARGMRETNHATATSSEIERCVATDARLWDPMRSTFIQKQGSTGGALWQYDRMCATNRCRWRRVGFSMWQK